MEKKKEEIAKRKEEREQKKKEKELEQAKKAIKGAKKMSQQRNIKVPKRYLDSDSSDDELDAEITDCCFRCGIKFNENIDEMIGCDKCFRWYHFDCLKEEDKQSIDELGVDDFYFQCDFCQ